MSHSLLFLLLGVQIGENNFLHALAGIGLALAGVAIGRAVMIYTLLPLHDFLARWLARKKPAVPSSRILPLEPVPSR